MDMSVPRIARRAVLAAGAGLLLGGSGEARAAVVPTPRPTLPVETLVLPNGLAVVVAPSPEANAVAHALWIRAGSADDPPGRTGLSALLAMVLAEAETAVDALGFAGGLPVPAGFCGLDGLAVAEAVAPARLDRSLQRAAARFARPTIDGGRVAALREVLLAAASDLPASTLFDQYLRRRLFGGHPYGRPIDGFPADVAVLAVRDLADLRARAFVPGNAVLAIGGAVAPDRAFALAERMFGPIPAAPVPDRPWLALPPDGEGGKVTVFGSTARRALYLRAWRAPDVMGRDPVARDALRVIAGALDAVDSPLRAALDGVAHGPDSLAVGLTLDLAAAVLTIAATAPNAIPSLAFEQAIDGALGEVLSAGLSDGAFAAGRRSVAAHHAALLADPATSVFAIGRAVAAGTAPADIARLPRRLRAVLPDQIAAILPEIGDPTLVANGWLVPRITR
jgi:zinc protease